MKIGIACRVLIEQANFNRLKSVHFVSDVYHQCDSISI